MLSKLSNLNSNLALLGYLNPALNNSAQIVIYRVDSATTGARCSNEQISSYSRNGRWKRESKNLYGQVAILFSVSFLIDCEIFEGFFSFFENRWIHPYLLVEDIAYSN